MLLQLLQYTRTQRKIGKKGLVGITLCFSQAREQNLEMDNCPLATALCNMCHSWAIIVAAKENAHLIHLLGTISVQMRTRKKRTLMTSYI